MADLTQSGCLHASTLSHVLHKIARAKLSLREIHQNRNLAGRFTNTGKTIRTL